ncbi:MAG TPA: extracellular solute-binding protein [Chloroflexota bacterium]
MSSWATDALGMQRENEQIQSFYQTHSTIKITKATVASSGYMDKLLAGLAASTGPDVFRANPADGIPLIQKGQLTNLDPLLQTTKAGWWGSADVKPGVMDWGKALGHQYGFPMGTGAYYALDINRDLFHAAGLADPALGYNDPSWTFDAVLAAAQKLTKSGGSGPTQFGIDNGMNWVYLHPVVMSFGGNYMDPKTGEFLWTSQPAVDAIQWVADLRLKQQVSPTPEQTPHGEFSYVNGKLGLSWSTFNLGMYLISTVGNHFNWDIIPPPHQPGKPPVVWFYVSWWVENKASKVPDAAWTYHYWLGGPEGQLGAGGVCLGSAALHEQRQSLWPAYGRRRRAEEPRGRQGLPQIHLARPARNQPALQRRPEGAVPGAGERGDGQDRRAYRHGANQNPDGHDPQARHGRSQRLTPPT